MISTILAMHSADWDFVVVLKWVLIIAGCAGVALVVVKACGWAVPDWAWKILLIVAAVFLGIIAINFLASL